MCTEQINNVCTTAFLREFLEDTEDNLLNKINLRCMALRLLHIIYCKSSAEFNEKKYSVEQEANIKTKKDIE